MENKEPLLCCLDCHRKGWDYLVAGTSTKVRLCRRCAAKYRLQLPLMPL